MTATVIKLTAKAPAMTIKLDLNHQGLAYRIPNKSGQGEHKFTAHADVTVTTRDTVREYRAAIYQTRNACNLQTVEVALYLAGRMLPEGHKADVIAAVIAHYVELFGLAAFDQEYVPAPYSPAPAPAPVTIDMTPTWASLVPAFVAMIESGTAQSRAMAIEELTRLARFADGEIARRKGTLGGNADSIAPKGN